MLGVYCNYRDAQIVCAQIADRILVMKGGKIVQDGKHEELVG